MHDCPFPFRSSPLFATPHAFLCTGTRVPYVGAELRESPGPDPKNRGALEGPAEAEGPDRLAATMREVLTKSLLCGASSTTSSPRSTIRSFFKRIESDRGRTGPLSRRHHRRAGECAGSLHRDVGGTQLRQGARPSGVMSRLLMLMFALELQRRA
jgi:hypothetical protein